MDKDYKEILREFTRSILYGDEEHQNWLLEECETFIQKYEEEKTRTNN